MEELIKKIIECKEKPLRNIHELEQWAETHNTGFLYITPRLRDEILITIKRCRVLNSHNTELIQEVLELRRKIDK